MKIWDRETVVAACVELDAERLSAGIMEPLNSRDVARYEGSLTVPSMPTISEYVGNMDNLQRELGRVTSGIAREWSDEEWRLNAEWALDVLEEESIFNLTQTSITRLSRAGLMPNVKIIEEVWGTVPEYRMATGIEKRKAYFAAKNWTKSQFVRNGRQYAKYLGRELGFPVMPHQDDIYQGSINGHTPSYKQIQRMHGSLEKYQVDIGFVNNYAARGWTDQQWKDNFYWLKDALEQNGLFVTSLVDLTRIASRLHVGPSRDMVEERWGTLSNFASFVGAETSQTKRRLSNEGVMRKVMQIVSNLGGPITREVIEKDKDLGINMVKNRFNGINKLNLRLGYITGSNGWDSDMLLWWGVTNFMASSADAPRIQDLDEWSAMSKGPSATKVYKEFGGSLIKFKARLHEAKIWMEDQVSAQSSQWIEGGRLDKGIVRLALTRNPQLFHPDYALQKNELQLFHLMKKAGFDQNLLMFLMDNGIDFAEPDPQLEALTAELDKCGLLNSGILKQLEPYIIGLAPIDPEMNWTQFISAFRTNTLDRC